MNLCNFVFGALIVGLAAFTGTSRGSTVIPEALQGLHEVSVAVSAAGKFDPVLIERLRAKLVSELSEAGATVREECEAQVTLLLDEHFQGDKPPGTAAVVISVRLSEPVLLVRRPGVQVRATTWDDSLLMLTTTRQRDEELVAWVSVAIGNMTDFMNHKSAGP